MQYILRGAVEGSSSGYFFGSDILEDVVKIGVVNSPGDRSLAFHFRCELLMPEFGPFRLEMASSVRR